MIKHKYNPGDRVLLNDGRIGHIQEKELSIADNVTIPSYWILFSKRVFSDGYARNTYESSIVKKLDPEKRSIIARIFKSK